MLGSLFHEILYRPLFNALIVLYEFLPGRDLGVAIVMLTVLVRLALTPLLARQLRSQRKLAAVQGEAEAIRKSTKDRAEQSRRMLDLYKHHGVSPVGGCLPILIQLPVLWAMYTVLQQGLRPNALSALYPFVPHPGSVEPLTLGALHLGHTAIQRTAGGILVVWPAVVLAVLTGAVSYWQARLTPGARPHSITEDTTPAERMTHQMSRQMLVLMPLMTVYFALVFPIGLALYWFVTTLVSVIQQRHFLKQPSSEALKERTR